MTLFDAMGLLRSSENVGEGNSAEVTQYLFCFIFFLFEKRRSKHVDQVSSSSLDVTWLPQEILYITHVCSFFYPSGGLADSKIIGADTKKMSQLHSWLHSRLQSPLKSYWSLCYRASSHGWGGSTFHSRCDNRGPTVTIIRAHGYIFGGYTDNSWISKFLNCIHI